jgi:hypothetical protein
LLRDGDGGQERLLGRRGIRRIALEQNIAADAVALRVKPTLSRAPAVGEDAVDGGEGSLGFRSLPLLPRPAPSR